MRKLELTDRENVRQAVMIQMDTPALAAGKNTLTFSAGAPESTVTVEGSTNDGSKGDRKSVV